MALMATRDLARVQDLPLTEPLPYYCTATNRQGERCGKEAIPGGTVCRFHGGAAPQVRARAVERIKEARDLALDRLIESLQPDPEYPLDPRVLADITDKFTRQVELLEGRATERKEVAESQAIEVRHRIVGEIERLASKRDEAARVIEARAIEAPQ